MLTADAVGVRGMFKECKQNHNVSQQDMHGFSQWDFPVRQFTAVSALSSFPSESVLLDCFKDDRFLLRIDTVERHMYQPLERVLGFSDALWRRAAQHVGDTTPANMKDMVIQAALAQVAFMECNIFKVLRSLPYKLALGNIEENLRALMSGPEPADATASKIWNLLRGGFTGAFFGYC